MWEAATICPAHCKLTFDLESVVRVTCDVCYLSVVKVVLWSRVAHLTKPGWSKPHTHSNPTKLALFRHKITLYRFNQGAHTVAGGSNVSMGAEHTEPPHFNHWLEISEFFTTEESDAHTFIRFPPRSSTFVFLYNFSYVGKPTCYSLQR